MKLNKVNRSISGKLLKWLEIKQCAYKEPLIQKKPQGILETF